MSPASAAGPLPWLPLGTLCLTTFLVAGSGTVLSPFLLDMARDFHVTLAAVANLVAILSIAGGVTSLVAGSISHRVGHRALLVAGVVTTAVTRIGLGLAPSYPAAAAWQVVTGLGGGAYMGTVFAAVSDRVAPAQRGRALGWVITGHSLSLLFGTPLVTWLGALGGWRMAFRVQGLATLTAAAGVLVAVPRRTPGHAEGRGTGSWLGLLRTPRVAALLGSGTLERASFATVGVYLAPCLQTRYGVSLQALAVGLALVALGNLAGNLLGAQLADRLPARPLTFAGAALATGALGLPLMLWHPGLAVSLALGCGYTLANAAGRPALLAALGDVPGEARGAVLGFNVASASFGWLGATAVGGWLVAHSGFGSLGVMSAALAATGAALAVVAWRAGGYHPGEAPLARTPRPDEDDNAGEDEDEKEPEGHTEAMRP